MRKRRKKRFCARAEKGPEFFVVSEGKGGAVIPFMTRKNRKPKKGGANRGGKKIPPNNGGGEGRGHRDCPHMWKKGAKNRGFGKGRKSPPATK